MRISRHPRRQVGLLAGGLLATAAVALPVAHAAPPDNDRIREATRITSIAAPFIQDTREATSSPRDGACVAGASVWYRYRPTVSRTLRAVTWRSNYDTILTVFSGPRSDRELVACNDDTRGGFSAVQVNFVAGRTYWIAVSSCCGPRARGRHAELRLYEPAPAEVTTTIDSVEAGDISGRLIVSGTTTCATPSAAEVYLEMSQRVGDGVASAYVERYFRRCTSPGITWRTVVNSDSGWAFRAGSIAIASQSLAHDGFARATQAEDQTYPVTLDPNARRTP